MDLNELILNTPEIMPKTLFIHSVDDPWVPWEPFKSLQENVGLRKSLSIFPFS